MDKDTRQALRLNVYCHYGYLFFYPRVDMHGF